MRHAKSDWDDGALADFDRTLNKRGHRDAPEMGRWMKAHGGPPDLIVCSPAQRAANTASLVAEATDYQGQVIMWDHLYPGNTSETIQTLQGLDDGIQHVLLIGHNPHSEELVAALLAKKGMAVRMPTSAVALLKLQIAAWGATTPACAALQGLITPKLL